MEEVAGQIAGKAVQIHGGRNIQFAEKADLSEVCRASAAAIIPQRASSEPFFAIAELPVMLIQVSPERPTISSSGLANNARLSARRCVVRPRFDRFAAHALVRRGRTPLLSNPKQSLAVARRRISPRVVQICHSLLRRNTNGVGELPISHCANSAVSSSQDDPDQGQQHLLSPAAQLSCLGPQERSFLFRSPVVLPSSALAQTRQ